MVQKIIGYKEGFVEKKIPITVDDGPNEGRLDYVTRREIVFTPIYEDLGPRGSSTCDPKESSQYRLNSRG